MKNIFETKKKEQETDQMMKDALIKYAASVEVLSDVVYKCIANGEKTIALDDIVTRMCMLRVITDDLKKNGVLDKIA